MLGVLHLRLCEVVCCQGVSFNGGVLCVMDTEDIALFQQDELVKEALAKVCDGVVSCELCVRVCVCVRDGLLCV